MLYMVIYSMVYPAGQSLGDAKLAGSGLSAQQLRTCTFSHAPETVSLRPVLAALSGWRNPFCQHIPCYIALYIPWYIAYHISWYVA